MLRAASPFDYLALAAKRAAAHGNKAPGKSSVLILTPPSLPRAPTVQERGAVGSAGPKIVSTTFENTNATMLQTPHTPEKDAAFVSRIRRYDSTEWASGRKSRRRAAVRV